MSLENPKNIPLGSGKREVRKGEQIPAVEVANEVVWVNPHIRAPFDIKEGEPTKLGLFASSTQEEKSLTVEARAGHGRSVILGQIIFEDDEGRKYRDIDLKGSGNIGEDWGDPYVKRVRIRETSKDSAGIFDYPIALKDASMAEEFLANGIRTYRVVAITRLKEILVNYHRYGQPSKISVEKAKENWMIHEEADPVVSIRAFGTRERIGDLTDASQRSQTQKEGAFEDARIMVAQELGLEEKEFSAEEYLKWFAQTLGQNIGRMHKLQFAHGYLTYHNITLDCRVVDLDSVSNPSGYPKEADLKDVADKIVKSDNPRELLNSMGKYPAKNIYENDMFNAIFALLLFYENIPINDRIKSYCPELVKIFQQSYLEALHEKK